MTKKTYDITIKEFGITKLPKAEAPETYVMNKRVNFNLSEKDFNYLLKKLNKKDPVEAELIQKLSKLIGEIKTK